MPRFVCWLENKEESRSSDREGGEGGRFVVVGTSIDNDVYLYPSDTQAIPSCTTVTTPDEEENIPERNDPQPTTTSSTPPKA